LTSPTPYDPPLTYGGWSQAKALGLRIAALLHQLDTDQAEAARHDADADLANLDFSNLDSAKPPRPKKKKRKIVIHSSPFLRCVQTSTAVAAGISQYKPPSAPHLRTPTPSTDRLAKSPRSRSPSLHSSLQHVADPNLEVYSKLRKGEDKILLRVDAFLGEWLSPDYYQDITPPPNSTMMVAGAKADLLRRGDNLPQQPNAHSSRGHFPGGWSGGRSASVVSRQPTENGTLPTQGSLAQPPIMRDRAGSIGSAPAQAAPPPKPKGNFLSLAAPTRRAVKRDYNSPAPSYSVSPADPIPTGYVAHAREACVQVDFQWDSMRPPQEWGDGGEYGDEWSTMHKRFRRGLTGMMQWYREHGAMPPQENFPGFTYRQQHQQQPPKAATHFATNPLKLLHENSMDDEEETVLVLVTHGAGCNALLGAITNQPVLVNAGLASLSMAVRRELPRISSSSSLQERRSSVADPGMTNTYDMKLVASIDHLRPGCNPALPPQSQSQSQSQTQSPAVASSPSQEYRRVLAGSPGSTSPDTSPLLTGTRRTKPSSLGSVRRTNSSSSSSSRYIPRLLSDSSVPPAVAPTTGLWSSPRLAATETPTPTPAAAASSAATQPQRTSTLDRQLDANANASEPTGLANALERLTTNEERERTDSVAPLPAETSRSSSIATTPPAVVGAGGGIMWGSNSLSSLSISNSSSAVPHAVPGLPKATVSTGGGGGGLWGAKPAAAASQGLWGPPKLDGVLEHERGAKRRWTVTERN
jgi:broad specificity phosphatase PhoE